MYIIPLNTQLYYYQELFFNDVNDNHYMLHDYDYIQSCYGIN